jgi:hypothetical protein
VGRGGGGRQWMAEDGGGHRRMAADNGGRRQFVGGVAVVWMMAVGSGVNNVWLIVSKRFFFAWGNCLPYSSFWPAIGPWLPPKQILQKNPGRICPRPAKKKIPCERSLD